MLILGQMVVFFLMIFAGALARRYNIIIPNNQEQFSSLIVNIACPSLIISAAMHAEEHMGLTQVIETYAAYAALLAMMCFVGFLLPLILRFRGRLRGAVNLSFWFNNSLFMGLPLVQGVYGDQAAVYMMMMIGASLKDIHVRHMLTDRKLLVYTFLKAVVLPIPILFAMKMFVTNPYILGCSLVIVAAPTGGMVAMVALLYNKVAYPLMTEIIALSTLISVATIPFVSMISGL